MCKNMHFFYFAPTGVSALTHARQFVSKWDFDAAWACRSRIYNTNTTTLPLNLSSTRTLG